MEEDEVKEVLLDEIKDKDYEEDKYGNALLSLDISDDILFVLFQGYIEKNNYSLVSRQHCEILNEKNKKIEEIISSTVINEIMYKILLQEIEKRKEGKENDSDS